MREVVDVHRASELLEPLDRVVGEERFDRMLDREEMRIIREQMADLAPPSLD